MEDVFCKCYHTLAWHTSVVKRPMIPKRTKENPYWDERKLGKCEYSMCGCPRYVPTSRRFKRR